MANHAFIDAGNVHRRIKQLGWKLDYRRLRNYLRDKYQVDRAFLFIGRVEANEHLYKAMLRTRYNIVFKEVERQHGRMQCNIDADLIVRAMRTIGEYEQAVLVSNNGDFGSLVDCWQRLAKLRVVLSPGDAKCSHRLERCAGTRIQYFSEIRHKLEWRKN